MNQKIKPCLCFDNQAEEAAKFYTSIFSNSKMGTISRYGDGAPLPKGIVMVVNFEIGGQAFMAINVGPVFKFSEAISFVVDCADQQEVDYFWEKLSAGGTTLQCGWLKDRYGVSWQIVPTVLSKLMSGGDAQKSQRVMQALMQMIKLDIKKLEEAYDKE